MNIQKSQVSIKQLTKLINRKNVPPHEVKRCIEILEGLHEKDVNIIDTLMTAYTKNKQYDKVIGLYEKFNSVHNDMTHLLAINACKNSRKYQIGHQIISENIHYSNQNNDYSVKLMNTLISFYGSFNFVETAELVFKSIPITKRDAITTNAMMTCYLNNNLDSKCISFYKQQSESALDATSHLLAIKASANMKNYQFGHGIIQKHIDYKNKSYSVQLSTSLIDFYSKFNETNSAENVFDCIPKNERDIPCIGAMMKMYFGNCEYKKVLSIHNEHQRMHNDMTNIIALKACQKIAKFDYGKQLIHEYIDVYNKAHSLQLKTTLINFFGHTGDVNSAQSVFASIPTKQVSVQSIGALMKVFIMNELPENAITLYKNANALKDDTMHLLAIKAMATIYDHDGCEAIIDSLNVSRCNINLLNTILDFYGQSGKIERAKNIFENIPVSKRDAFTITSMMNGYCRNGMNSECVELFKATLQGREKMINDVMIHVALKACIHETLIEDGKYIYDYLKRHVRLMNNIDIRCNLICLFGKANDLNACQEIFAQTELKHKTDIKIWNAMMNAYSRNDEIGNVLDLWHKMRETNVSPDESTIMYLLTACNSSNDIEVVGEIEASLNKFCEGNHDEHFMDDLSNWPRKRVLDTLNTVILLVGISRKRLERFDEDYDTLKHAAPISNWRDRDCNYIKKIMSRVYMNSSAENDHDIRSLIQKLQRSASDLSPSEYLRIMNAHALLGNIDEMMKIVSSLGFVINNDILICLLRHLNRNGETKHIAEAWNHIKESDIRLNPSSLKLLTLCISKTNDDCLLSELWHFVMDKYGSTLNMDCLCLLIPSLSKSKDSNNQNTVRTALLKMESDQKMLSFLQSNDLKFNQILISYGNIGELDKMWLFYTQFISKHKENRHNIDSLMILAVRQTKEIITEILSIIEKEIDSNRQLTINQMVGFNRIAAKYEHSSLQQKLSSILHKIDQNNKIKQNVIAKFKLNDKLHSISNGYDVGECSFDSNKKVDALIKSISYQTNTSICPELPSEEAKICVLKSHAEKKALAILIMDDSNNRDIKVKVNLRMCADCHEFYCQISKHYNQYNIQCIDPKGTHQFENGVCKLCHG